MASRIEVDQREVYSDARTPSRRDKSAPSPASIKSDVRSPYAGAARREHCKGLRLLAGHARHRRRRARLCACGDRTIKAGQHGRILVWQSDCTKAIGQLFAIQSDVAHEASPCGADDCCSLVITQRFRASDHETFVDCFVIGQRVERRVRRWLGVAIFGCGEVDSVCLANFHKFRKVMDEDGVNHDRPPRCVPSWMSSRG
jgi:hypothetical protein